MQLTALIPFRHAMFRNIWLASMVSNFGGLIQTTGAAWLMTGIGNAREVALVQAATSLPIVLLSLPAGAAADRFSRRTVMAVAQIFMLVVSAVLAGITWAGWLTPALLLTFTFLIGLGTAANSPAWQASVGDLVSPEDIPSAVALNSLGFSLGRSLGPAIGGLIVAVAGAAATFAVNAVSYVGLIAVLLRWHPVRPARPVPSEPLHMAIVSGLKHAAASPGIRSILLRGALFGVGAGAVPALMPLVARNLLGGNSFNYGLLFGAFGAGSVVGASFAGKLRHVLSTEAIIRVCAAAVGVCSIVCAFSHWLALSMVATAVGGAGWVIAGAVFNTVLQLIVPRHLLARSISIFQMTTYAGMALGSWLWGGIVITAGIPFTLMCSAAVLLLLILTGFHFRLPDSVSIQFDVEPT